MSGTHPRMLWTYPGLKQHGNNKYPKNRSKTICQHIRNIAIPAVQATILIILCDPPIYKACKQADEDCCFMVLLCFGADHECACQQASENGKH